MPLPTSSPKQRGPAPLGLAPPSSFTQAPAEVPPNGGMTNGRMPVGLLGGGAPQRATGRRGRGVLEGGRQRWLLTLHSSPLKRSRSSETPPLGSLGGLDDTPHGALRRTCAEYQTHILCRQRKGRGAWSSVGRRKGRWGSGDLERPRPDQTRPDPASTAVCVQSAQKTSSARWPAHAACFPPARRPPQAQLEPMARGLTAGCPSGPQKNH